MVENPLADRDLPLRVGIDQQAIAGEEKQRIGEHKNP